MPDAPFASPRRVVYAAEMRYAFAALFAALVFAGCTSDAEERAFFNDGWIRPEKAAEKRLEAR